MEFTVFSKSVVHWSGIDPMPLCMISQLIVYDQQTSSLKKIRKYSMQLCSNKPSLNSSENESTSHFFLHCHFYTPIRNTLLDELKKC